MPAGLRGRVISGKGMRMSDLIDREALLRQIDIDSEGEPGYYGDTWKFIDTIKSMPPAGLGTNLAEVGADCISREQAIDAVMECYDNDELFEVYEWKLNELPAIQPKRGRWVLVCDNNGMHFICNKCGAWRYHQEQKFCGECGADMREKGENSESN